MATTFAPLRKLFWNLYGSTVWDALAGEDTPLRIARVVETLAARRVESAEPVLDAGCGTGAYVVALARAGFAVTGADFAPGMLARAAGKIGPDLSKRVALRYASLDEPLPFLTGAFAHVLALGVLQTVADPAFTLGELRRVLRPGGMLLVTHQPRPAYRSLPVRREIALRCTALPRKSPLRVALVAAKTVGERAGQTRYWTAGELRALLAKAGFTVDTADAGPPIFVVATRAGDTRE